MRKPNKTQLCRIIFFMVIALMFLTSYKCKSQEKTRDLIDSVKVSTLFTYEDIKGNGLDSAYNRRDNSDIIKVGDTYYIWYSRMDCPQTAGYWATIWYATSKDEGHTWQEQGMALGLGKEGEFDSQSVFTPNILVYKGKYYLYYTGVKPTPGNIQKKFENNSTTDITGIGLAVADHPNGPFVRVYDKPILEVSKNVDAFDSFRIDDASLMVRDGKICLYYKGRSLSNGVNGWMHTKMGVAFADNPKGPFVKYKDPILEKSHEVLVWKRNKGVASLASISKTMNYAEDGLHFSVLQQGLVKMPSAPGLYRPDLEDGNLSVEAPKWGISIRNKKGQVYLVRFEMK